jgi:hypothetical protein
MCLQPMVELLAYLRANGFKTYVASAGGVEFMRPRVQKAYGVPPEQIIGSSVKTKFEAVAGKPDLVRLPEVNFIDDHAGKPVGIYQFIGRRPIAAFGNSDGDQQMLEWTAAGSGPSSCSSFTIPTPPVNTLTTANPSSANSIELLMKPPRKGGP